MKSTTLPNLLTYTRIALVPVVVILFYFDRPISNWIVEGLSLIPAVIILCREILVSGLREFLAEVHVSVPVTQLAKWKTGIQMGALSLLIIEDIPGFFLPIDILGLVLLWVAALLTLITGFDYLRAGLKHM